VNKRKFRVLLDTSFILPFLGFKTDEVVMKTLPKLRNYDLYYSDLSLLEALWKIVKVIKREDLGIVVEGLKLIKRDLSLLDIDERAVEVALTLYICGHKDLIDNLLYGIAVSKNTKFLTVDKTLKDFVKEQGYVDVFIHPEELE